MHLDNSACNLASLNLLKFLGSDGHFDVAAFRHAVEIVFLAQEIIVGNSSYPTERITQNARDFRQLGLGYANLGAMLMALGKAYDSDGGRSWAGSITALMTGHAYRTSARIAQVTGPFAGYSEEPRADAAGDGQAPRRRRPDRRSRWSRRTCSRPPAPPGTRPSSWARSTATATPRPACSPRPGPSAC